jgi:hypothetical protein
MVKRAGFALVAVVALFACAGTALGGGTTSVTIPITFDLYGPDTGGPFACSQLVSGQIIHGTGEATFSMTPSGMLHSVINGTATDGSGGSWVFNYSQNARPLGSDGSVQVTDHFNLVGGEGGSIKLHSHFVAGFTSSDLESADILYVTQVHGDPFFCDPI